MRKGRAFILLASLAAIALAAACDRDPEVSVPYQVHNDTGRTIYVEASGRAFSLGPEATSDMLFQRYVWESFSIDSVPFEIGRLYIYEPGCSLCFTISLSGENYSCGTTYVPLASIH